MNILFVCSRNKWRSATAESIYQNHPIHHVKSAGTAPSARTKISSKLINWADMIFVMEKKHKQKMSENYTEALRDKTVIILEILDEYQYMDEELIAEIEMKVTGYL